MFILKLFTYESTKTTNRENILKKRTDRREEERLRKLNRTNSEKEYDEYLDWFEKEEAREEMLRAIDAMSFKK